MGRDKIELLNMEFYSYHGCFEEEQIIGNKFIVSYSVEYNMFDAAVTDSLESAVNYQEIYGVISEEMAKKSKLLENVAYRILTAVKQKFPQIESSEISVSKLNPPIGGKVEASKVIMSL